MGLMDRLKRAFNAFVSFDKEVNSIAYQDIGYSSSYRPDRFYFSGGNERSIIASVYTRIAIDVSNIDFRQVVLDDKGNYESEVDSSLNRCLKLEANKDQASRFFMRNIVQSMFDTGVAVVVPVDTKDGKDIYTDEVYSDDIITLRVGTVETWYPDYVSVNLYDDRSGQIKTITVPKRNVAVVENPFYNITNNGCSVLSRLIKALNLMDIIDSKNGSGKLDLIIQLPYIVKTDARKKQARDRYKEIEDQLATSKYGVAYTDGTEKITQLNRPVDNNLQARVEYLTSMLFSQLGVSQSVLDGTADEKTMMNYFSRTIKPVASAIVEETTRKWISATAYTQRQRIMCFHDPFQLVPVEKIADMGDKFIRNEIMTANEIRQKIGLLPIKNGTADELRNPNMPQPETKPQTNVGDVQTVVTPLIRKVGGQE